MLVVGFSFRLVVEILLELRNLLAQPLDRGLQLIQIRGAILLRLLELGGKRQVFSPHAVRGGRKLLFRSPEIFPELAILARQRLRVLRQLPQLSARSGQEFGAHGTVTHRQSARGWGRGGARTGRGWTGQVTGAIPLPLPSPPRPPGQPAPRPARRPQPGATEETGRVRATAGGARRGGRGGRGGGGGG